MSDQEELKIQIEELKKEVERLRSGSTDRITSYNVCYTKLLREQEGMVMLGKATMDEFAMGSTSETCAFGVPKNPWNKEYVAGGSSGGSAATVASGECLGSLSYNFV